MPLSLTEMCSSIMQSLIQAPSSSPSTPVSFLESGRYTPVTSVFGTRDTTVGNVERKVQTAPRRKISYESRSVTPQKKTASSRATGSLGTRRSAYIPPVVPPKMEDWMPDQQVSLCVICQERFSMVSTMSRLSLEMFECTSLKLNLIFGSFLFTILAFAFSLNPLCFALLRVNDSDILALHRSF